MGKPSSLYLDKETNDILDLAAKETGWPKSRVVRACINYCIGDRGESDILIAQLQTSLLQFRSRHHIHKQQPSEHCDHDA